MSFPLPSEFDRWVARLEKDVGFKLGPEFYILDERGEPQPESDALAWARWHDADRERCRVRWQTWRDASDREIGVSTVFMGIDHGFGRHAKPVLWETMVFIDDETADQRRYTSRQAAIRGHNELVRKHGGRVLEWTDQDC